MESNRKKWQEGIEFDVRTGCSIKSFLCNQLEIDEKYINERIAVIFIDGNPVDNIEETILKNGSVLSLSGQLPGLVGAAMSKNCIISPFRANISAKRDFKKHNITNGKIKIKLFNSLIDEIGDIIIKKLLKT